MKKIDETEEICVIDYLIQRTDERIFDYTKVRRFGEDNFTIKSLERPMKYPHILIQRADSVYWNNSKN